MFLKGILVVITVMALTLGAMSLLAFVTRPNKPIAVADESFAAIDGGSVRYQMAGNGKHVVLFLHGFNGTLNMWDRQWELLSQCPIRRLRIDIPGFGASQFEASDYGLAAQADRLNALLDNLDISRVTVVGGSMGGSLAVALAARHPQRVEQLVLLAPSGYPGALRHEGVFGLITKPGITRRAAHWLAGTSLYKALFPGSVALQATSVSASYGEPWVSQLERTKAPAFVAWSKGDRIAHADSATSVVAALSDSTLFWLDESAGHDIATARPEFVAKVACLIGQGMDPEAVAAKLSAEAPL